MRRLAKTSISILVLLVSLSAIHAVKAAAPSTPTSAPKATNYYPAINSLFRITYPADSNTIAYQVQRKIGASGAWKLVKHSQELFYGDKRSKPDYYYYRYRRVNLDGYSGYSPSVKVTVGSIVQPTSAPKSSYIIIKIVF